MGGAADHNKVKTPGSAESIPLSQYACGVLQAGKKESPVSYVFSSPVVPNKSISTVKTIGRWLSPWSKPYLPRKRFCDAVCDINWIFSGEFCPMNVQKERGSKSLTS